MIVIAIRILNKSIYSPEYGKVRQSMIQTQESNHKQIRPGTSIKKSSSLHAVDRGDEGISLASGLNWSRTTYHSFFYEPDIKGVWSDTLCLTFLMLNLEPWLAHSVGRHERLRTGVIFIYIPFAPKSLSQYS